jgi:hypothetical protein
MCDVNLNFLHFLSFYELTAVLTQALNSNSDEEGDQFSTGYADHAEECIQETLL